MSSVKSVPIYLHLAALLDTEDTDFFRINASRTRVLFAVPSVKSVSNYLYLVLSSMPKYVHPNNLGDKQNYASIQV